MKKLLIEKQEIFVIWVVDELVHPPKRAGKQFVYVDKNGKPRVTWCGRKLYAENVDGGFAVRQFSHVGRSTTFNQLLLKKQ